MARRDLAWLALVLALGTVALLRVVPAQTPYPFLAMEGLAFWALMPAYPLAALAWRSRRRTAIALTIIALVHLGWSFEWVPRIASAHDGVALRVLDTNLLAPRPSDALARELLDARADVLVVQELSDEWLATLDAQGARERYPHRIVEPHSLDADYFGIGIFSRSPLEASGIDRLPGRLAVPLAWADLRVGDRDVRIESVHTAPPATSAWASLYREHVDHLVERVEHETRDAMVLAGDFNASPFSHAHRRLLGAGLREAHESVGRGLATTWPNGVFLVPPMRLDHVYVRGAGVRSVRELPAITSDHSPIVADLLL
jgi:endonuclease/exonuclease/phosphatase (EEP) superfamily protein YafD